MTSTETMYEKITSSHTKLVIKNPEDQQSSQQTRVAYGEVRQVRNSHIKYKSIRITQKRERQASEFSQKTITGRVAFTHVYSDWGIMNNPERKSTQGNKSRSN